MSSSTPTVAVSWEIAPYLIPKASKGDPQACLLIIKLACPEWKDVTIDDFSVEMLGGGFRSVIDLYSDREGGSIFAMCSACIIMYYVYHSIR